MAQYYGTDNDNNNQLVKRDKKLYKINYATYNPKIVGIFLLNCAENKLRHLSRGREVNDKKTI